MIRKAIFSFDDINETGIESVPLNSLINIEDDGGGSGSPKLIYLFDKTGITASTTIDTLLDTMDTQWVEVGSGDLDELGNVTIISKQDGDIVKWDTTTSQWVNQTVTFFSNHDITASADQDTFIVDYNPAGVEVFIDGVKLRNDEYTATNGTTVVLDYTVSANTWVQIRVRDSIAPPTHGIATDDFVATDGQTVFTCAAEFTTCMVFIEGIKKHPDSYTISNPSNNTEITLSVGTNLNEWVEIAHII